MKLAALLFFITFSLVKQVLADELRCEISDNGKHSILIIDLAKGAQNLEQEIQSGKVLLTYKGVQSSELTLFPTLRVELGKQSTSILIPVNRKDDSNGNSLVIKKSGRTILVICMQIETT